MKRIIKGLLFVFVFLCFLTPIYAEDSDFVIEDGVLKDYKGTEQHVVIPDGVTEIDNYAFFGNQICSITFSSPVSLSLN